MHKDVNAIAVAMLAQIEELYDKEDVDKAILVCSGIIKLLTAETVVVQDFGTLALTMRNPLPVLDAKFPDCLRIVANVLQARAETKSDKK